MEHLSFNIEHPTFNIQHFDFMNLLLARYKEIATAVAERLIADDRVEVLVASGGVSNAIAGEILKTKPNGVAGLRLETIETFARRVVNSAGEFPRVATEPERQLAMRMA
ncbi:MAG: hypothetical protein ACRD3J_24055, partial [Thermoanaerobaculia bacterium]